MINDDSRYHEIAWHKIKGERADLVIYDDPMPSPVEIARNMAESIEATWGPAEKTGSTLRVYLAGPMRGIPEYNYPAFNEAARVLRAEGYDVFNPAEQFDGDTTLPVTTYMRHHIPNLLDCDLLMVLPNWQASDGARLEVATAKAAGLYVVDYTTRRDLEISDLPIEEEATAHVYGDRTAAYGHPATDFERTGKIWGAILGIDAVPPHLVALCMTGLKISREVNKPKRDNRVDGIGYWICADRIIRRQEEEE